MARVVIVCPMEIERKAIMPRVGCAVECCGPGPDRMRAYMRNVAHDAIVLLAGIAGGLTMDHGVPVISEVVDAGGARWTPPVRVGSGPGVRAVGVDAIVSSPQDKASLAQQSGAAIVDCESHVFAQLASERGMQWGVVRAVSDGPSDHLPVEAARWVTDLGGVALGAVLVDMLRRPSLIGAAMTMRRQSSAALESLREALAEYCAGHEGTLE
ncbi:MAG: hypothetical protein AAFX05_01870 [Planctomycetota bacterium]